MNGLDTGALLGLKEIKRGIENGDADRIRNGAELMSMADCRTWTEQDARDVAAIIASVEGAGDELTPMTPEPKDKLEAMVIRIFWEA